MLPTLRVDRPRFIATVLGRSVRVVDIHTADDPAEAADVCSCGSVDDPRCLFNAREIAAALNAQARSRETGGPA
jgi:hypothetical protein